MTRAYVDEIITGAGVYNCSGRNGIQGVDGRLPVGRHDGDIGLRRDILDDERLRALVQVGRAT